MRPAWLVSAGLFVLALAVAPSSAQTPPERSLPDAPRAGSDGAIIVGETDYGAGDEQPLGVDLSGVRLVGLAEAVSSAPPRGVSVGNVPGAPQEALQAALAPFIGQPLTRGLITRLQGAVAGVWRTSGYPFMSVTVPPQEVTSGVLTLRVVEFTAGRMAAEPDDPGGRVAAGIRQQPGARIEAPALEEDLDWINRNPYRRVEAIFAPGGETGASDIALKVTRDKPFSVFASYDNAGGRTTGRDRWSAGGGLWVSAFNDLTLSYRLTRSSELWRGVGLFSLDPTRPDYLSHAGRIDLPTLPRQALSVAPSYVATNEIVAPFTFRNETFELPVLYRSAVSNIFPGHYFGDVYFGVEAKWVKRETYLGGVPVAEGRSGLFNVVLGWSHTWSDPHGRTSVDARLKANPGGIVAGNDAANWTLFTGGRVTEHRYVLGGVDIARVTTLPAGFSWVSELSGVVAGRALPDPERLSLGGFRAVRGYDSADAPVDAGVIWRNELRLPAFSPLGAAGGGLRDHFSPFVFLDLGRGRDIGLGTSATLASLGAGIDYTVATHLSANLTGAFALVNGATTPARTFTLTGSVRVSY